MAYILNKFHSIMLVFNLVVVRFSCTIQDASRTIDFLPMRLKGGHGNGCCCGSTGEIESRWLFEVIDRNMMCSLNTKAGHDAVDAFRPFCEIRRKGKWMESEDDDQILVIVQFLELVNLKSIGIVSAGDSGPGVMKIFIDKEITDFDEACVLKSDYRWEVVEAAKGPALSSSKDPMELDFQPPPHQIRMMTIFIERSRGAARTIVNWIGLRGEATQIPSSGVVDGTYELRPQQLRAPGAWSTGRSDLGF
mmetsp:Transcript_58037/g.152570  ORF Transcript_58037/g.152570 Transcript_58037/m.152570 type:complete len:249 (+) Transcript_58037:121-867(+)